MAREFIAWEPAARLSIEREQIARFETLVQSASGDVIGRIVEPSGNVQLAFPILEVRALRACE